MPRRRVPAFDAAHGFIEGCRKDGQTLTSDWTPLRDTIAGVTVREVKNVPKGRGFLTEVFRRDWATGEGVVDQVFQVWLSRGEISAWHVHGFTLDRLFVARGLVKIVLYDARSTSATFGQVDELCAGTVRPLLVTVPPGVWHGLQNVSDEPSGILNLVDHAYDYEDPDHWRLPSDSHRIPFRFADGDTRGIVAASRRKPRAHR